MNLPRYEIIRELGQGKSGITYLAKDKHLPSLRLCAVKQLKPKTNDPKQYELIKERFIEEARHLENLCKYTDQVPELYEFYISDGDNSEICLIEQWIAGKTLAQRLSEKEPITAAEVRGIVTSLLLLLEILRSEGIIHRDIKPENIILRSTDGKPILIDFGVVKEVVSTYTDSHGNPATSSIIAGTEGYMAPEQLLGRPVFSSDLYSVGMTVIHLLTRRHPLSLQNSNGEITWREYSPTVSDEFATVINKAIEQNHLRRYPNAAEMLSALKACPESRIGGAQVNISDNSSEISSFSISEDSTLLLPSKSIPKAIDVEVQLPTTAETAVDLAVEIGNDLTRIFRKDVGLILSEPTIVAVNRITKRVEAVGRKGEDLLFITHDGLDILNPIKDCKVQHRPLMTRMLRDFFSRPSVSSPLKLTRVVMPIISQLSQVNRNALIQAALDAGAREVYLVDAATCAAIGGGVQAKETSMIVHVGESSTEVMVIRLGRRVSLRATSTGTNDMRESIVQYFKRRHNLLISKRTAETIWTNIGCAYPLTEPLSDEILGRNLIEGIPKTITVTDEEVREALSDSISIIINTVRVALERTPPEFAADILERGILLSGGGALLKNLDKRLSIETGIHVSVADNPEVSMLAGAARMLSDFNLTPDGTRPTLIAKLTQAVVTKAGRLYGELISPFCRSLALDLGAANTHIYAKSRGVVVSEPSIVAMDAFSNQIVASGREAKEILRGNHKIIRPIREDGSIQDLETTKIMLKHFLLKARRWSASRPQIVASVPVGLSQVERDAFINACQGAGAYKPLLVENSISAAIGAGLSIAERGVVVVDVGAANASVSVISSSRTIYSRKVLVAGWFMDESIVHYFKRKYNLLIGERTAEAIKIELGSAYPLDEPLTYDIRGRNLIEGIPKTITISDEEVREALMDCVSTIINAVRIALERTPPELSADIVERGILLTGGGALLKNLDKRLSIETGLPVMFADDPLGSSILGLGKMLSDHDLLESSILRDEFVRSE